MKPNVTPIQFPKTDCNLHTGSLEDFNSHCANVAPSFRSISRDYFDNEEQRSFATEAVVFGTILTTALVPLIAGAETVFRLLGTLTI